MAFAVCCDFFRGQKWLDGQILGKIPWFCSSAVSQRERCALCRHAQGILIHFCIVFLPWISMHLHNNYNNMMLFICNLIMSTDSIKQTNNNAVQPPFTLHSGNQHKRTENHCSRWLSDFWKGLCTAFFLKQNKHKGHSFHLFWRLSPGRKMCTLFCISLDTGMRLIHWFTLWFECRQLSLVAQLTQSARVLRPGINL